MPYLEAIIKETLRMHPTVGYSLPRKVRAGGLVIGNDYFAAGVSLMAGMAEESINAQVFYIPCQFPFLPFQSIPICPLSDQCGCKCLANPQAPRDFWRESQPLPS